MHALCSSVQANLHLQSTCFNGHKHFFQLEWNVAVAILQKYGFGMFLFVAFVWTLTMFQSLWAVFLLNYMIILLTNRRHFAKKLWE